MAFGLLAQTYYLLLLTLGWGLLAAGLLKAYATLIGVK